MKTIINIRANKDVKENAQKLAKELGFSLSDILNASLRNFIRTREVYCSAIPRMIPEFERFLGNIEKDIKAKKNLSSGFSSMVGVEKYLDNL